MTDERLKEIEKLYAKLCEEEGEEGEVAEEPSYDDLVEALPVLGELLAEVRSQKEQWRQDLDVTRGRLREAEEKVKVRHDCYRELARAAGYNGDTSEHADVMSRYADEAKAAIVKYQQDRDLKFRSTTRRSTAAGGGAYEAGRDAGARASLSLNARALAGR